jgi:hypothetical protein
MRLTGLLGAGLHCPAADDRAQRPAFKTKPNSLALLRQLQPHIALADPLEQGLSGLYRRGA